MANSSKSVDTLKDSFADHPYLRSWNAGVISPLSLTEGAFNSAKNFRLPQYVGYNQGALVPPSLEITRVLHPYSLQNSTIYW